MVEHYFKGVLTPETPPCVRLCHAHEPTLLVKNYCAIQKKSSHFFAVRLYNSEMGNLFTIGSGRYWVKRVRQLPRTPLFENTAYSFILVYIFLKITMKLLQEVGNLRTKFI